MTTFRYEFAATGKGGTVDAHDMDAAISFVRVSHPDDGGFVVYEEGDEIEGEGAYVPSLEWDY